MDKQTFAEIVSENFEEIHHNFQSGLKSKGYEYNEDLMNDAFISCNSTLMNKKLTKQEALRYYWTSYINKYKTWSSKKKYVPLPDDYEEYDDEPYNTTKDEIYRMIIDGLIDKFGIRKTYIWELYACQGVSAREIIKMGFHDVENFVYFNRQIKRYIQHHIIRDNKKLQELIDCRKGA